ncbi:MAG: hypothetical protein IT371_21095 [Deltaproteobacteria bacterium]|nr:hypothetical protein [Deltaproteobacteria bacterium]
MRTPTISLLLLLAATTSAHAVPADLIILFDSSASMAKPHGSETRLAVAKRVASDLIKAASDRHRFGLVRFAQKEGIVESGEGKINVRAEDSRQCQTGGNLLASLGTTGAEQALRWLDGVDSQDNPEVVPLGDSPLYRSLRLVFEYVRVKRLADPLRHCVNTQVIVITDGEDTCAGGGELKSGLAALAAAGDKEDIRTLVFAFNPQAEAAQAIARIGQGGGAPRLFGPDQVAQLVDAVKGIEGRFAPEACLASKVAAAALGLKPGVVAGKGTPPTETVTTTSGCGCETGASARGRGGATVAFLLFGLGAILLRRRRGRLAPWLLGLGALLGVAAFATCSTEETTYTITPGTDGGLAGAGKLVEPTKARDDVLERGKILYAEYEQTRKELLAPLLDPEKVFAAISGDATEGCLKLARSISLEPYEGFQRGPATCLATRRCSGADKALLLQACLKSKGIASEIKNCFVQPEERAPLVAEAAKLPEAPDLSAVKKRLDEALAKAGQKVPGFVETLRKHSAELEKTLLGGLRKATQEDAALLAPLANLDAAKTFKGAQKRLLDVLDYYYFVDVDGKKLDPTLSANSPAEGHNCSGGKTDVARDAVELHATIKVRYLQQAQGLLPEVPVGELSFAPIDQEGKTLTIALVDAATQEVPAGLPAPAATGCLRAVLSVGSKKVVTKPFHIGAGDGADCPEASAVPDEGKANLARVELELEVRYRGSPRRTVSRMLIDRYNYAMSTEGMERSGPVYSDAAARRMMPLRVDLPLLHGLPVGAAVFDTFLATLLAERPRSEAALADRLGLPRPKEGLPPVLPPSEPYAVQALVAREVAGQLPAKTWVTSEWPWLLAVVQRRTFTAVNGGLDVAPTTVFDVLESPLLVHTEKEEDAAARQAGQLALGALVTEGERLVTGTYHKSKTVVNAGAMLRQLGADKWGLWGAAPIKDTDFPYSVRTAAYELKAHGHDLVVTNGPQPFLDEKFIAWWRVDEATGQALGEVRLDGTIYGSAGVQLIADIDRCLFATASDALAGIPDDGKLACCVANAIKAFIENVMTDWAKGGIFAAGSNYDLGSVGLGPVMTLEELNGWLSELDELKKIAEIYGYGTNPETGKCEKKPGGGAGGN